MYYIDSKIVSNGVRFRLRYTSIWDITSIDDIPIVEFRSTLGERQLENFVVHNYSKIQNTNPYGWCQAVASGACSTSNIKWDLPPKNHHSISKVLSTETKEFSPAVDDRTQWSPRSININPMRAVGFASSERQRAQCNLECSLILSSKKFRWIATGYARGSGLSPKTNSHTVPALFSMIGPR